MGFLKGLTDAAGNALDYFGDNLENNQSAVTAQIERERAITKIELQRAGAEQERNKEMMKMAGKALAFMGFIVFLIVLAKYLLPAIKK
jgi:hypothetical protein